MQPSDKAAEAVTTVTSHKKLVTGIYKMALKRESQGIFYYKGDSGKIFDGDINTLLDEVCAIDKKTTDDADYLAWSISKMNIGTRKQYVNNRITGSMLTVQISYLETAAQLEAVNTRIAEVLSELGIKGKTAYQKVKLIHDYIVNNTRYQSSLNCHTAYGALFEGRAVCQGYAQLTYKMLSEAGLKCYIITGQANNGSRIEDHAWNMVKAGKKWYYLDVTWDDPVGAGDVLRYNYFLVGSRRMDQNHAAMAKYSKKTARASKNNHSNWKKLQN